MAFNAGDIEAKLTIDRSPFQRGLREAKAEADAFEKRRITIRVDFDTDVDKLERKINRATGSRKRGITIPVDVDQSDVDQIKKKLDSIADSTETTARRSGNRMARALLNPIVLQLGLLPGIAAASSAAAGLAIGALAVGFGAVAVAAVKNNKELKDTWADTWDYIKTSSAEDADVLVGRFQKIGNDVLIGFRQIRPEMQEIFRDIDPLIQDFSDGIIGMATEAVPRFEDALAVSGPTMRGFESMLRSIGVGVGQMAVNISDSAIESGEGLDLLGVMLRNLLSDLGRLISMFSGAWASVGPEFVDTFDKMIDVVLEFTNGGLSGFSQGMHVTLSVMNALMAVLGPFADMFGALGGYGLAAAAAWKLVAGSFGLVAKAVSIFNPVAVAARLSNVSDAMTAWGTRAGQSVTNVTGSAKAGERLASTTSRVGNALVKAGSYLPLFGLAVAAVGMAQQAATDQANEWAEGLLKGGQAAEKAQAQIDGLRQVADEADQGFLGFINSITGTTDRMREQAQTAEESYRSQRDELTQVELAQIRAKNAQAEYDAAVREFGENSSQARTAQEALATSTNQVEAAQARAAQATQDHTDRIIEQTNLMLGAVGAQLNYQGALLQLEQSEKGVTEAIKAHGKGSIEARQADTQYQQNLLSVIQAVGARSQAEAEARGETNATEQAAYSMRYELIRLALQAGKNVPPALETMINQLSDSELAAFGVERQSTKTGTAIRLIPGQKNIRFPTDAPQTKTKVDSLATSVRNVPTTHYIDFFLRTIGSAPQVPAASQTGPGLGMLGTVPRRAGGGPVKANRPYWVGDAGMPELYFPKTDGFILNGNDSKRLAQGKGINRGVEHPPFGSDGSQAPDFGQMVDAFMVALQTVMGDGLKLRVSGPEWAKLVNETNARNERR